MKAVLIDHDDSFTHNLRHWLKPLFTQIDVVNHRDFYNFIQSSSIKEFALVVLSPGPKFPSDYPQTLQWLQSLPDSVPVYGVCLGLQLMAYSSGVSVQPYTPPLHGKKSKLSILDFGFDLELNKLENKEVARYHSLFCDFANADTAKDFKILAASADDQLPMWVQHQTKKWMGVQFHPESFLTEDANLHLDVLNKWLNT